MCVRMCAWCGDFVLDLSNVGKGEGPPHKETSKGLFFHHLGETMRQQADQEGDGSSWRRSDQPTVLSERLMGPALGELQGTLFVPPGPTGSATPGYTVHIIK